MDATIRVFHITGKPGHDVGFILNITDGNGLVWLSQSSDAPIDGEFDYYAGNAPLAPEFRWRIPAGALSPSVSLRVNDQMGQTLKFRVDIYVDLPDGPVLSITPRHRLVPTTGVLHVDAWSNVTWDAAFSLPATTVGQLQLAGPRGMQLDTQLNNGIVHWRPLGNQLGAYTAWVRLVEGSTVLAEQQIQLYVHPIEPAWWTSKLEEYAIIKPGFATQDFAPVTVGQVRYVAEQFKKYVLFHTGVAESELVIPTLSGSDFRMVTLGELKNVAEPFYQVALATSEDSWEGKFLHRTGDAGGLLTYPWTNQTSDDSDFSPATVGQLKAVFSCSFGSWRWSSYTN
jgi:hypothetical protein